jgi:hypothetical protein
MDSPIPTYRLRIGFTPGLSESGLAVLPFVVAAYRRSRATEHDREASGGPLQLDSELADSFYQ